MGSMATNSIDGEEDMKCLIVAYWHDPRFKKKKGGLIRMFSLADNLLALGYEVRLILPKLGFPRTQTQAPVDEIPFLDWPVLRPLTFHFLCPLYVFFRCLAKQKFVYVRQMNSFLPLLVARLMGAYIYFEVPNDPYLAYSLYPPIKRSLVRSIDRLCFKLSHYVIVLSQETKRRMEKIEGMETHKILVFPSGTDTDLFTPRPKEEACQRLGFDPQLIYIGFVGSFLPYQGVETLIEAAPYILAEEKGVRFLLVGDGPRRKNWEQEVKKKRLEKYFVFSGQVPYEDVPLYLGVMDICVAPHRRESNQSSPVKIFDYMAAGKPVVASNIEAVREITEGSTAALLNEPDDPQDLAQKISFLLKNKEKRQEMGREARAFAVAHFDRKMLTARLFSRESWA
ncbi:MAG: glycosyltransferase family 4 protein [Syntrophales bacterium]|nr:glycosyltransferase family 4 protein [Syntrophales bacterium]